MHLYIPFLLLVFYCNCIHSQFQLRVHQFSLKGPDLKPAIVNGAINIYNDTFQNAYRYCVELVKIVEPIDPSYMTRCMAPLIHSLRLNTTKLFGSALGWYGEGVMYATAYGYERSSYYHKETPSTLCMLGLPSLISLVPLIASQIVQQVYCIVPHQYFEAILRDITDPSILSILQSFEKHVEIVDENVFMDANQNEPYHHICDMIHIQPSYSIPKQLFEELLNFLLTTTFPFEAHRIFWMKDTLLDGNLTNAATDNYQFHDLFEPVLSSQWEYNAGFNEFEDSSGFLAKSYHGCSDCIRYLTQVTIGTVKEEFLIGSLWQPEYEYDEDQEEDEEEEEEGISFQDGFNMNSEDNQPFLYHYHPNPHSFNDQPPFYYHNMILISYTIRVFADTAYGLYEALYHAGYTQVYIVHDMTLFTLESIVIHHCKELFSEGFQRQYGETAMEDRWYCEGLLEEEGEEEEGDGRKQKQKQRRQRQRQRKVRRIPTESMLQIALGAHDVTMFLPHYIVYHMEQLWSDIAFGHYKEQYYTALRNAVSIWTFSSLHRDYLELEGFAGKVHTLFLYSNHSISQTTPKRTAVNTGTEQANDTLHDQFPQQLDNKNSFYVVRTMFFGSCSSRRVEIGKYIEKRMKQYNRAVYIRDHGSLSESEANDEIEPLMQIKDEDTVLIALDIRCGGWKELLFDYDLDEQLFFVDIVLNIHNEQLFRNNDGNDYFSAQKARIRAREVVINNKENKENTKKNTNVLTEELNENEKNEEGISLKYPDEISSTVNESKFHGNVLEVHRINYLLQLDKFIISEQGNDEYLQHQYTEMVELVSSIDEMIEKIIYFANHGEERRARVMKQGKIYERWNKNVTVLHEIMKDVWNKIEMIV